MQNSLSLFYIKYTYVRPHASSSCIRKTCVAHETLHASKSMLRASCRPAENDIKERNTKRVSQYWNSSATQFNSCNLMHSTHSSLNGFQLQPADENNHTHTHTLPIVYLEWYLVSLNIQYVKITRVSLQARMHIEFVFSTEGLKSDGRSRKWN